MSGQTPPPGPVAGILLAGGLGRRMGGGDKPLRTLGGRRLIDWSIERARAQTDVLVLNANGDPVRFAEFGLPVVADAVPDYAGPLAGVLAGMEWARIQGPEWRWIATFATDAPFVPLDLVARLAAAVAEEGADIGRAASGGRAHPVFALWPVRLADDLRRAMVEEEMRKIDAWTARYGVVDVEWPVDPLDPFFNVNRPDDLAAAEAALPLMR